jgi:hypothetical protein
MAQAQPGAAVALAQWRLQQASPRASQLGPLAARRPVAGTVAKPALALGAVAAAVSRPAPVVLVAR